MPTLISISPDGASRFVGVDDESQVLGGVKLDRNGGAYIDWKPVRSEYQERSGR
jgi:hypothetical protein